MSDIYAEAVWPSVAHVLSMAIVLSKQAEQGILVQRQLALI